MNPIGLIMAAFIMLMAAGTVYFAAMFLLDKVEGELTSTLTPSEWSDASGWNETLSEVSSAAHAVLRGFPYMLLFVFALVIVGAIIYMYQAESERRWAYG